MTIQTVKIPAPNLPLSDTNRALRESPLIAEIRARLTRQDDGLVQLEETRTKLSEAQKVARGARAQVRALEGLPHDGAVYREALEDVRHAETEVKRLKECEEEDKNTLRIRTANTARAARDFIYAIDAGTI